MYHGMCVVCREFTTVGYGRCGEFTYCPLHVRQSLNPTACSVEWVGPRDSDLAKDGTLLHPVPPERWPYGPPTFHQTACLLFSGALYCDCEASSAEDAEYGEAHSK